MSRAGDMHDDEDFGGQWVEKPDGTLEWIERERPAEPVREPEPFPLEDDECVDDPEALRAAEEAVARPRPERREPREPMRDVKWVPVVVVGDRGAPVPVALVSYLPFEYRLEVQEMGSFLQECGVEIGWDPYPPTEVFTHMYRGPRTYSLVVPEGSAVEARRLLEERFPEWRNLLAGGGWAPPEGYEPEGPPDLADERSARESWWRLYRWYIAGVLAFTTLSIVLQVSGCVGL